VSPGDFARYITTVLEGMAVQAAGGATCEELLRVAEMALRIWPSATTEVKTADERLMGLVGGDDRLLSGGAASADRVGVSAIMSPIAAEVRPAKS
jgi:hypothetical protein